MKTPTLPRVQQLSSGRPLVWISAALFVVSLLLPGAVLAFNPGDCLDDNLDPTDFVIEPGHLCMQGMNACPAPYQTCVLIGAPATCPQDCKYRFTLRWHRGSYCQPTDDENDQCRRCPGQFVCEEYGIYKDKQCKTRCTELGCKTGHRLEQGLCDPSP